MQAILREHGRSKRSPMTLQRAQAASRSRRRGTFVQSGKACRMPKPQPSIRAALALAWQAWRFAMSAEAHADPSARRGSSVRFSPHSLVARARPLSISGRRPLRERHIWRTQTTIFSKPCRGGPRNGGANRAERGGQRKSNLCWADHVRCEISQTANFSILPVAKDVFMLKN